MTNTEPDWRLRGAVYGVRPCLPDEGLHHTPLHAAGSHFWAFAAQILPSGIPDPTQEACSPRGLVLRPLAQVALDGHCVPHRTRQRAGAHRASRLAPGLSQTETGCSYLPGAHSLVTGLSLSPLPFPMELEGHPFPDCQRARAGLWPRCLRACSQTISIQTWGTEKSPPS